MVCLDSVKESPAFYRSFIVKVWFETWWVIAWVEEAEAFCSLGTTFSTIRASYGFLCHVMCTTNLSKTCSFMLLSSLNPSIWHSLIRALSDIVRKYYSPGTAELVFGGKSTGMKNLLVVFDTGSSYTYFGSQAYDTLATLVSLEATVI